MAIQRRYLLPELNDGLREGIGEKVTLQIIDKMMVST